MCLGSHRDSILAPPEVIIVPEQDRFVAKDRFVKGVGFKARVPISGISKNFENWFLAGDGIIEEPLTRTALCHREIKSRSGDDLIISEVGGDEKVETALSQIHFLMGQQSHGKEGTLLIDKSGEGKIGNVFFRKDVNGVLRIVYVPWCFGGWLLAALPAARTSRSIQDGHRVFSRY